MSKQLPFDDQLLRAIADSYGTPVYVYDQSGISATAKAINQAFGGFKAYRNFFAVKATPTPAILKLVAGSAMGFDCSSMADLKMVEQAGLSQAGIFFSSNNTPDESYIYANKLSAIINLDKASYFEQLIKALGQPPTKLAFRYSPDLTGFGNQIIGSPTSSKFGDTAEHIIEAVTKARAAGVAEIGLHTMVVSNERDPRAFEQLAQSLRQLADTIFEEAGVRLAFINIGGGIGLNYLPSESPADLKAIAAAISSHLGQLKIAIYSEFGRYLTGAHGYLLSRVSRGIVKSYKTFLTIDSSVNNIARLASVQNAYHHISIVGKEQAKTTKMSVVGSMCTNSDQMFIDRQLPLSAQAGDLLVIHDAGAHCRASATNYNGLPRCGEVLVEAPNKHRLIRRHESLDDLFATTKGL